MLVLSRNLNESLIIDGNIKVTILEIHKGSCRIGIDAPKEVSIDREEIYKKKQQERES